VGVLARAPSRDGVGQRCLCCRRSTDGWKSGNWAVIYWLERPSGPPPVSTFAISNHIPHTNSKAQVSAAANIPSLISYLIHLRDICPGISGQCNDGTIPVTSDRGGIPQSFQENPKSTISVPRQRKATTGTMENLTYLGIGLSSILCLDYITLFSFVQKIDS